MTGKSLKDEAVKNVGWQGVTMGSNLVLKALILVLLARSMPAAEFGVMAAAMVVASLAADFSQLGVHRALVQRLHLTTEHIRSAFAISLLSGLAMAALLYLSASWLAGLLRMPQTREIIEFLAAMVIFAGIAEVSASLMQRARRFRALGLIELGSYLFGFGVVALSLAMLDFGAWALAIGQMAQVVARMIAMLAASAPAVSIVPRWQESKDLLVTGYGFSAGQIGNYLATQADYFVVGRWLGAEALGLYGRAYQFLMLPTQVFGKVTATVLFPTLASIQDQPERVARAYVSTLGAIAIFTLPVGASLAVIAPELIPVLLGENWSGMIVPFQILVVMLLFRTSYKISDAVILAMGSMYKRAVTQFVYAGAVAAGSLLGIPFGLPGVAVGVGAAVALNHVMTLALALRITGATWRKVVGVQLRQVPGAIAIAGPVWLAAELARRLEWPDIAVLGAVGLAGLVAAAVAWLCFRRIFGAEGQWLWDIASRRLSGLRRTRTPGQLAE